MIAPSTRHVPLLLGLAVLLAFPILRSRFEVRRVDDCARPAELLQLRGLRGSSVVAERYEKYDVELRQWSETDLRPERDGMKLRGALIRSFRPIDLYTRPPTKLLGPIEAGQRDVEWVDVDGERVPIQTIYDSMNGRHTVASWVFVYEGVAVEQPVWRQLRSAPAQVWSGTRPLSLLLVAGPVTPPEREQAREIARRWLVDAYRLHRDACSPEGDGAPGSP